MLEHQDLTVTLFQFERVTSFCVVPLGDPKALTYGPHVFLNSFDSEQCVKLWWSTFFNECVRQCPHFLVVRDGA